jgi:cell division protein FtsB
MMEALVGWLDPDEAAQLRAELEAAKAEIERLNTSPTIEACRQMIEAQAVKENDELTKQLAARDLVIKQVTDLASAYLCNPHHGVGYIEEIALIQPTTEALDEYVSQAVEQEREACAALCESLFDADDDSCTEAETCASKIRARKP